MQWLIPLPLCESNQRRNLELFDHPDVHKPSQVIVSTAGIVDGVASLESKHRWRILTKDIVYTHGEGGVVQDILPARHGIRNWRRFLFLAHHFLATLGIPRHRRCFHRRREDQADRKSTRLNSSHV